MSDIGYAFPLTISNKPEQKSMKNWSNRTVFYTPLEQWSRATKKHAGNFVLY